MSEYQYYEFRAIDRSLSNRELTELRALSGRAGSLGNIGKGKSTVPHEAAKALSP